MDYPLRCRYPRHDHAKCKQVMQVIVKPMQIGIYDNLCIRNLGIIL